MRLFLKRTRVFFSKFRNHHQKTHLDITYVRLPQFFLKLVLVAVDCIQRIFYIGAVCKTTEKEITSSLVWKFGFEWVILADE